MERYNAANDSNETRHNNNRYYYNRITVIIRIIIIIIKSVKCPSAVSRCRPVVGNRVYVQQTCTVLHRGATLHPWHVYGTREQSRVIMLLQLYNNNTILLLLQFKILNAFVLQRRVVSLILLYASLFQAEGALLFLRFRLVNCMWIVICRAVFVFSRFSVYNMRARKNLKKNTPNTTYRPFFKGQFRFMFVIILNSISNTDLKLSPTLYNIAAHFCAVKHFQKGQVQLEQCVTHDYTVHRGQLIRQIFLFFILNRLTYKILMY